MPLECYQKHMTEKLVVLEREIRNATRKTVCLHIRGYSEGRRKYVLEDRTRDVNNPVALTSYLTHREIMLVVDAEISTFRRIANLYTYKMDDDT